VTGTHLELNVEPRGKLPLEVAGSWERIKSEQQATLRRGVGVVRIGEEKHYVPFAEVWAIRPDGLAVYASGNTDLDAIQSAVAGQWIAL
jgi:hypothetical protein